MFSNVDRPFVHTLKEHCRVCYTCVRECPAKAIRIYDGQAEVIPERCIGCGNCVRVCSQRAKRVADTIGDAERLLNGDEPVAALLAPSFAAEFHDMDYRQLVAMLRELGFEQVVEVAFGADLVARAYRTLLEENPGRRYIATTCPAIILYVERYHPELVPYLAPVVSPMIATARMLHALHGRSMRTVFIGPCIAKKCEAVSQHVPGEIDSVLTFAEVRCMFRRRGLSAAQMEADQFDPPHPGMGAILPVSRGLLQAAGIGEDLLTGDVVAADGGREFTEAIKEFAAGSMDAQLLEVLACRGCIMGAGSTTEQPLYQRRQRVSRYARKRLATFDRAQWERDMATFASLDLRRTYASLDQRLPTPGRDKIQTVLARMGKFEPEDELNCGACGYDTCQQHAIAILKGLAEGEMCLPYTIDKLKQTVGELAQSNAELATTQEALMQSEKLASMGQLAAGIAHEVNNPLGVVLMYAHLLMDEVKERDPHLADDLKMITEQADRCKKIVAGLLHFARQNKVTLQRIDVRELVEQALRGVPPASNVERRIEVDLADPYVEIDRDQILQVLTNLISNAYGAMSEGGTLSVCASDGRNGTFRIAVGDTGHGIPEENRKKIFEPFFTTKEIGKGTGLGLSVTYGIIKMHRGDITVESNADAGAGPTGTIFTVTLPRSGEASSS